MPLATKWNGSRSPSNALATKNPEAEAHLKEIKNSFNKREYCEHIFAKLPRYRAVPLIIINQDDFAKIFARLLFFGSDTARSLFL